MLELSVRFERTIREPHYKAGVEGETKTLPQHVALELAAEGYVTLLDKPQHVPSPTEIEDAEAAKNAALHAASLTQGEPTNDSRGEDQGDG